MNFRIQVIILFKKEELKELVSFFGFQNSGAEFLEGIVLPVDTAICKNQISDKLNFQNIRKLL
ncbi:hypothetical protein CH380_08360 [Leptospira adleri]|uniref:Uncharacterized protein n=1 Tax=Leptospira adleri TaxID=2023186 RepID=A0A2M9YPY1_9LEPT|nr:hypothetical protein CH380_08360 [Leptospira adleri]PJZ61406.1 hypothetical protein CH376_13505 [Leptospira adleri]